MSIPGAARNIVHGLVLATSAMAALAHADDCVRSTPSPIFPADLHTVRDYGFRLQSDHEAAERFRFGPNMQVRVEHGGCEYFVTKFRFQSPALFSGTYSPALAYRTAASLLQQLNALRPESGFELDMASKTLLRVTTRRPMPMLDKQFAVRGDGVAPLEAVVVVNAAGRRKSFGYLEVTLFRGPL